MSNIRAVAAETVDENKGAALVKIEDIKRQVETFDTFFRSNPFLKEPAEGPQMVDGEDDDGQVFLVCFERNAKQVNFETNGNDGNILGWWSSSEDAVSFAPTDTEALIKFLAECGYFNGHEAMAARKEQHEKQIA
jgi:hypothetical protein